MRFNSLKHSLCVAWPTTHPCINVFCLNRICAPYYICGVIISLLCTTIYPWEINDSESLSLSLDYAGLLLPSPVRHSHRLMHAFMRPQV